MPEDPRLYITHRGLPLQVETLAFRQLNLILINRGQTAPVALDLSSMAGKKYSAPPDRGVRVEEKKWDKEEKVKNMEIKQTFTEPTVILPGCSWRITMFLP